MVDRLDYKIVGLAILFLLCWMGYSPLACRGTEIWSDDFNDGDYDGWTICENLELGEQWPTAGFNGSQWSATNNHLHLDQEDWGIITHPSDIAYGTWSFDIKFNESIYGLPTAAIHFISSDAILTTDDYYGDSITYWLNFYVAAYEEPYNFTLSLDKRIFLNHTTLATSGPVPLAGWHQFDVTRNTTGWFSVYLNGSIIPIIEVQDTEIDTSDLFWLWFEEWLMIDNVVVDNEVLPPIPTTPTTTPEPIDPVPIAIIGVAAVVIIAVVVIILKRR